MTDGRSRLRRPVVLVWANAFRYAAQLSLLYAISHVGTTSDVGNYVLSMAITAPVFVVATIGLPTLLLTQRMIHRFPSYVATQSIAAAVACIFVAVVAMGSSSSSFRLFLIAAAVAKTADLFQQVSRVWLQRHEDYRRILISSTYLGVAMCALPAGLAWADVSPTGIAIVTAAVMIVTVCAVFIPYANRSAVDQDFVAPHARFVACQRATFQAGVPLGLAYGTILLLTAVPQYLLAYFAGNEDVAKLGIVLYLVLAGDMVVAPAAQVWATRARQHARDLRTWPVQVLSDLKRYTIRWAAGAVAISLGGALAIGVVFGEEYRPDHLETVLVLIVLLMLPSVHLAGSAIAVRAEYRKTLGISLLAVAVCVVCGVLFIPTFGLSGALTAYLAGIATRSILAICVAVNESTSGAARMHQVGEVPHTSDTGYA